MEYVAAEAFGQDADGNRGVVLPPQWVCVNDQCAACGVGNIKPS